MAPDGPAPDEGTSGTAIAENVVRSVVASLPPERNAPRR
jgi:hypothetical protein